MSVGLASPASAVDEMEPNDSFVGAEPIPFGAAGEIEVNGTVPASDPGDFFAFNDLPTLGSFYTLELSNGDLGIGVYDATGALVACAANAFPLALADIGPNADDELVVSVCPVNFTLTACELNCLGLGEDLGDYVLTVPEPLGAAGLLAALAALSWLRATGSRVH